MVSGSGSPRSSLRTTSARMHQNVCLLVFAFFPLPFPRSYVVLTRLPSTSTCEPFLIVVATYSASRGRNTQTPPRSSRSQLPAHPMTFCFSSPPTHTPCRDGGDCRGPNAGSSRGLPCPSPAGRKHPGASCGLLRGYALATAS